MRLIDADGYYHLYCELYENNVPDGEMDRMAFVLQRSPTVEAEPVKHGRWVDRYGGKYVNPKYECSECRKEAPYRPELDDLFNWYHEQELSNYCPNCGAKMDGGLTDELLES